MAEEVLVPVQGFVLIQGNGEAETDFQEWMEDITSAVNNLQPLTGTGTPEGFQVASVRRWYVDTADTVGQGIYFKETGDGNIGWIKRS